MKQKSALIAGMVCLIAAQLLASFGVMPLRAATVSAKELYTAVQPGEFAGTLLLGGFRGLACDLLWMRGNAASEHRRFYESIAIYQVISRIQPRFEQIWIYMSWDMAYNIANEVDDEAGKWSWYLAGLDANVRGCHRNPRSDLLLRNLAWMFHHKGETFQKRIIAADWAPLLNPLIADINVNQSADTRISPWPSGAGQSNFRLSAYLYEAALKITKSEGTRPPAFARRMIPNAIENDGNLWRNQGQHFRALTSYLDALDRWRPLLEWLHSPVTDDKDAYDRELSVEAVERNEGRLRRKAAELARILAPDGLTGESTSEAILLRQDAEVRRLIAQPGWKAATSRGGIVWLDEK